MRPLWPAILVLLLQGCAVSPACPSQDLPIFLNAFAESVAVQRAFITFPLLEQRIDATAIPGPATVERFVSPAAIELPLFPSAAVRRARSLELRVVQLAGDRAQVTVFKQDTDEQVRYLFTRDSCWRLERISDEPPVRP